MQNIEYKTFDCPPDARFSILIPTWNNLDYLQCCLNSIKKNSRFPHQIILHVNEGSDGTREWVEQQKLDYTYTKDNAGICYAMNAAASLARTDYLVYINDDMYVAPDWDLYLWEEVERLDHIYFLLGSALIEPGDEDNTDVIPCKDFGDSLENFKETAFLEKFMERPFPDWNGAGGSAVLVHKKIWDLVGGYSVEFSPGFYSDSDFSMKLWQAGVRYFKGISKSRMFHFISKSVGRISRRNDGRKQFAKKWKLTSYYFFKNYLRMATPFEGPLREPEETLGLKISRWRARWL
jgi:glycosyltransferase involved in cell wall biosynthesis